MSSGNSNKHHLRPPAEEEDDNSSDNSRSSDHNRNKKKRVSSTSASAGVGSSSGVPEAALNHLMKSLQAQQQNKGGPDGDGGNGNASESGCSSNGGQSDNSALVSLGNTSFGFNFDSDERFSNKNSSSCGDSNNGSASGSNNDEDETDSDGNERQQKRKKVRQGTKGSSKPIANTSSKTAEEAAAAVTSMAAMNTTPSSSSSNDNSSQQFLQQHQQQQQHALQREVSSLTTASSSAPNATKQVPGVGVTASTSTGTNSNPVAATDAIDTESAANHAADVMESIANQHRNQLRSETSLSSSERKRKARSIDNNNNNSSSNNDDDTAADGADSGGYNTDDDERKQQRQQPPGGIPVGTKRSSSKRNKQSLQHPPIKPSSNNRSSSNNNSKRAAVEEQKREERNQREKERSFRISKQITELRDLLSSGGVVVPKGTKSSVLTEAARYIRLLQQHQYRSEIDRHQLVQQMQLIGGGAHGPQAAQAIRHFAAQNGVWSLGNFGGVPPKSALTPFYNQAAAAVPQPQPSMAAAAQPDTTASSSNNPLGQTKIDPSEYRFIFNSCGAGIAIASMGGAFIDCNQLFCQLSNYTKQEVCALTIFNLTARQDLQLAFDQISQLISPPLDEPLSHNGDAATSPTAAGGIGSGNAPPTKPIVLRGSMKNRDDLGMSISLVRGDGGIAKCFCVTLVKNPASPFDVQSPVPVSHNAILGAAGNQKDDGSNSNDMKMAPAFTSG